LAGLRSNYRAALQTRGLAAGDDRESRLGRSFETRKGQHMNKHFKPMPNLHIAEVVASLLATSNATDALFWREVEHQMARRGYGLRLADNKALAETELRVIRL
jgi:hypothetical protein